MSARRKRLTDVENSPTPGTTPKRRRAACKDDKIQEQIALCQEFYDALRDHKSVDGRTLTEWFLRAPSRRSDPKYYELIKQPIDFNRIHQKLKIDEYKSYDEFISDVQLLIENNKAYYQEDSDELKATCDLEALFAVRKDRQSNGTENKPMGSTPSPSSRMSVRTSNSPCGSNSRASATRDPIDQSMVEDILASILDLTDDSGRLLSPPFRVLQSEEEFPTYYEKIKEPIDLKTIAEKARAGAYTVFTQLDVDIRLLCKNAKVFNEPGSTIYKDSTTILRFFTKKVKEANNGQMKAFDDKRLEYNKDMIDALIAQSSSSDVNDAFSEDSEEDEDTEDADDSRWKLYWTIRNAPDDQDKESNMADPFLELPTKTYYPDYFDEIERPISLFMINKKLKRGEYEGLAELVEDFMQMFDNACSYNLDGSEIHSAARKLQKLVISTARTLDPAVDLSKYIKQEKVASSKRPKAAKVEIESDVESEQSEEKEKPKRKRKPTAALSTGLTPTVSTPGKPGRKTMDELQYRFRMNLMKFWQHLYDFRESDYWPIGAFMDLPSNKEYPDYYEVIKRPIDMAIIRSKIENNGYGSSEELIRDFSLMFNNCRKYNEPGSQLHGEASRLDSMVHHLHATTPGTPIMSPVMLKEQHGWLRTKLPAEKKVHRVPSDDVDIDLPMRPPPIVITNGHFPIHFAEYAVRYNYNDNMLRSPAPSSTPRGGSIAKTPRAGPYGKLSEEQQNMWTLFNDLKDYKDETGRKLATFFLRLPSKQEYPEYYDVIKKPMDFQRIHQRLNGQGYPYLTELCADMTLMFDNACKYNEPDSQLYKDAVTLASILMTRKRELGGDGESMPRVQVEIRSIFTNIFVAVFNKKDAEGRCLSDSLTELPDLLKARGIPSEQWPFSFEQIKKNIDKCRYRRLERFQKDFFELFETAREVSRSDSQMFDDASELQLAFIKERDERCKSLLASRGLLHIENSVKQQIELQRHKKARIENDEDKKADKEASEGHSNQEGEVELEVVEKDDVTYKVHEYAYVQPTSENAKSPNHIIRIERLFKDSDGHSMVRGRWLFRPHETFHRATRKFIENEVFLTHDADTIVVDRLIGKCAVLFLPTFVKQTVKGFEPKDTYVCEFKYLGRQLHFKKLKAWPHEEDSEMFELEDREEDYELKRVPSNFAVMRPNKHEESEEVHSEASEDDDRCKDGPIVLDIDRPEVIARCSGSNGEDADGRVHFQQMVARSGKAYAQGDFVLVFNPQKATCDVMRIDKLWREADGSEHFSGGWFARPADVTHDSGRMFYKREVFAVGQPDQTRSVSDIQSRCVVLSIKDAVRFRPTEIPECDVFVCESRVEGIGGCGECSLFIPCATTIESDPNAIPMNLEHARKVRTFKNYTLSAEIAEEELFYFKTPIVMEKEMSPLVAKNEVPPIDLDVEMEEVQDGDGTESTIGGTPSSGEMKAWLSHQPKLNAKSKSGYILFSAEVRKRIMHENPDAGFGEVSKIVGVEWKKLTEEQKKQYEVRAEYIATERAKHEQANSANAQPLQPNQCRVWMCKWINCEFMCDHADGLYDHLIHHHTSQIIPDSEQQFVCMWGQCVRNRKDGKPFPSLPRLHRHIKEKHMPSAVKVIYNNQRGRTFYRYVPPQTDNGSGQLLHYPYGMHPTQVAQAQPQGSVHLPPQLPAQSQPHLNGDSHHHPRMNGGADAHHYQQPAGPAHHPTPHPSSHYSSNTPGPSYATASSSSAHPSQQSAPAPPPPHPAQIADPAKTVVTVPRSVEPVFVPVPNSVHVKRVLHTETYLRYIESLNTKQRTVSKFDRSLTATARNTQPNGHRPAPYHWVKNSKTGTPSEEELTSALWKLRDQLIESTVNVSREYTGPL